MPSDDQIPEPWNAFLKELDTCAPSIFLLECIGGFVVTMPYGMSRATGDLDVVEITPTSVATTFAQIAREGGALHRKHGIYLDYVTVAQAPYEYKGRMREMFPGAFRHIRLMALDAYDLALTKLQRNIERDRGDVRFLARTVPFRLDILRDRYYAEQRPYLPGNLDSHDLTLQLWIEAIEEDRKMRSC